MEKYTDIIINAYEGYARYLWKEIMLQGGNQHWYQNYFYLLLLISAFFFAVEIVKPWRKEQSKFRKDFWMDFFYMFFNFFLFSLIFYNALSEVFVNLFKDALGFFGVQNFVAIHLESWPVFTQLLAMFFVRDFVQWWGHRALHFFPRLWEFHKVHHSVEEMGFAAHLRYHWFENVFYRTFEYLPLAMLGFGIDDFFVVHVFTLAWGHFNHSNITINPRLTGGFIGLLVGLGSISVFPQVAFVSSALVVLASTLLGAFALAPVMRKVFNSPEMHIWHHAHDIPETRKTGVNFGITLAIWDYLFGTAYVPHDGRDIKLGFPGIEQFPKGFVRQSLHGFGKPPSANKERSMKVR